MEDKHIGTNTNMLAYITVEIWCGSVQTASVFSGKYRSVSLIRVKKKAGVEV